MTDKDKMIEDMAKVMEIMPYKWGNTFKERAEYLFNAGIRPARGFQCRGCTEYADGGEIEPKQYEEE